MSDFYITLPSNSSMDQYPENHGGHFYTKLPQSFDLSSNTYEVGLAEIQFSNSYNNIKENQAIFTFEENPIDGTKKVAVPEGLYPNAQSLINKINYLIKHEVKDHKHPKIKLIYSQVTKKVTVKFSTKKNKFLLNPFLGNLLGLEEYHLKGPANYDATKIVDLHRNFSSMYIYCDLVSHRPVGDSMVPLLRVVPVIETHKDLVHVIYDKPHYFPIGKRQFDTVEILLSNDSGEIPSFQAGKSIVTLHVRPRRYP